MGGISKAGGRGRAGLGRPRHSSAGCTPRGTEHAREKVKKKSVKVRHYKGDSNGSYGHLCTATRSKGEGKECSGRRLEGRCLICLRFHRFTPHLSGHHQRAYSPCLVFREFLSHKKVEENENSCNRK